MDRVDRAARRVQRDPNDVTVVAISKTFGVEAISEALDAGATDVGENRAQELKEKVAVLGSKARWHFVGRLQSNKVRLVVGAAALIHSVDRFGVAEAIARRARALGITQDVLIEVNIAGEPSKSGVEPARAIALAEEVESLSGIAVSGVMAIPPMSASPEAARAYFRDLAELGRRLEGTVAGASELSMGMTRDFELAIEEGATLVRIGQAIFGPRGPQR
jgi:pyridoxal phosphate enzyme (YggS family)